MTADVSVATPVLRELDPATHLILSLFSKNHNIIFGFRIGPGLWDACTCIILLIFISVESEAMQKVVNSDYPGDVFLMSAPDDWHVHLRDGVALKTTVAHTARCFRRAVIMPNLDRPVTTLDEAMAYKARIEKARPQGLKFSPLMTLYLTEDTTAAQLRQAHSHGIFGVKYYPAGATTNSRSGVRNLERVMPALEAMAELQMPLLMHGEVADGEIDPFDREAVFIDRVLQPLLNALPQLKLVLEHITTEQAVACVRDTPSLGATITAHHLLYNRSALFRSGLQPDMFCRPVLQREHHRLALLGAATGGEKRFFLGTDSAPHGTKSKYCCCGRPGIYTAPFALELYTEAFARVDALDQLEGFACRHGSEFYGLPPNQEMITIKRMTQIVPDSYQLGDDRVVPLLAGQSVHWQI